MSKLYIIPTPIGNLNDITLRALTVLKEVDLILAEDTRTTKVLLTHFSIDKRVLSHHQHNEHNSVPEVVKLLESGQKIALVSDAGTPAISDPGFLLVREALKKNIEVECLPGATAFVPALVNSGIPCERFCFEGFLPQKKGRMTALNNLKEETRTMVFYESPHRLLKALEEFSENFGTERKASVSRELTKVYEETQRGTLAELISYFSAKPVKGEIVIIVEGKKD